MILFVLRFPIIAILLVLILINPAVLIYSKVIISLLSVVVVFDTIVLISKERTGNLKEKK